MSNIEKEVKKTPKFRICDICGCKQYTTNYARHTKTKKHKEAYYAYNKFEIEKYKPPAKKKTDYLIMR